MSWTSNLLMQPPPNDFPPHPLSFQTNLHEHLTLHNIMIQLHCKQKR